MVVLGVVLVLLAFAVGALLVAGTASLEGTVDVSVPGGTLSLPPLTFLVLGMLVITVFWLGWAILRSGVRRGRKRRLEAKEAEARRVAEEQRLKDEFAARERALIEERDRAGEVPAGGRGDAREVVGDHVVTPPGEAPRGDAETRASDPDRPAAGPGSGAEDAPAAATNTRPDRPTVGPSPGTGQAPGEATSTRPDSTAG